MANVTQTTAAKFINDVWANELNRAIMLDRVIVQLFTDKTKDATADGGGQVYHLVARHNLTANTKTASVDATPEAITETEQTFTPSTHQITAQEIENFAEVMSRYNIRAEYTSAASYALARAQEVAAAALLDDNTTQTVGVLGSELTDDNLIQGWTYLKNSASKGATVGVVAPATWGGLLKVEKFTNQLYNGDTKGNALHEAQIGRVYQSTFYVSQLTVGTSPNSSGHMWGEGHFFKIIKKPPTQDSWYSPLAKAFIVATDQIYGMFERQEADEAAAATTTARLWGVRLQSIK